MLKVGDRAPAFELESDAGEKVSSRDLAGKRYVIYFYPKDSTPGCTREAQAFTYAQEDFAKLGVPVYGVSKDSVKSHCSFKEKFAIEIPLLSDPKLDVHGAYGAYGEKVMYGKKVQGVLRSTFVVGADGTVEAAWPAVKVDGHADAVLAFLRGGAAPDAAKKPAKAAATKAPAKKAAATKAPAKKAPAKRAAT
jgi:peroxiredoxin Q/BCP